MDLARLIAPAHTALVTQECQRGVIGEPAIFPDLAAAAAPIIPAIARLAKSARAANVPVIHCVALRREDGRGSNDNARLFAAASKAGVALTPGSEPAAVHPALEPDASDLLSSRYHGVGPMAGTDLDPILRNLGVRTIVGVGVSINVGITNFVMDAVNRGYRFVLARDCVAGIPADYARAMMDNTLSLLATIVDSDEVIAAWPSA
jgi:biuret amidohydrolase